MQGAFCYKKAPLGILINSHLLISSTGHICQKIAFEEGFREADLPNLVYNIREAVT